LPAPQNTVGLPRLGEDFKLEKPAFEAEINARAQDNGKPNVGPKEIVNDAQCVKEVRDEHIKLCF